VLATICAATFLGVTGLPVVVEVHVSSGLSSFAIVGQPDSACREARDRVRAAIMSSGLTWPNTRITINLAPADVKKVGASLDLAMAIGILVATGVFGRTRP
jgi:magnesium chelatase family protein